MAEATTTGAGASAQQGAMVAESSVPEQLELLAGPASESMEQGPPGSEALAEGPGPDTGRAFVPSNRERILRQLGALVLSPAFPHSAGTFVAPSGETFIVHDGLRGAEIEFLAYGRPQRFPVLAEIRDARSRENARAIGIHEVVALHFRTAKEADDFRFRPVDELDTEYFLGVVSPDLFSLEGDRRISDLQEMAQPRGSRLAVVADRIAGGVCCLLELAVIEPGCLEAVSGILSGQAGEPWLEGLQNLLRFEEGSGTGAYGAIMQAFMEHERASPSALIEGIGRRLSELPDPDVARAVPRWLEMANGVLSNHVILDGENLADDRSIASRSATLAAVVDNVKDLVAFLHAERPAGRKVVAAAAFLIGLRTGAADLSWKSKRPHLDLLSSLLVGLHRPEPALRAQALSAFQEEPDERSSPIALVLYWHDREVLRWSPQDEPASVAAAPLEEAVHGDGGTQAAQPASNRSESTGWNRLKDGPDGRVIEVMSAAPGNRLTSLRVALLPKEDRLCKSKEIFDVACTPGMVWRVGLGSDGAEALYADVPGALSDEVLGDLMLKLGEALSLYLLPRKPKKASRSPKGKRAKAADETKTGKSPLTAAGTD